MTIIRETFTLPSKGKIYKTPINPEVRIRSMTTDEELLRLNPKGKRKYKLLSDIIDACVEMDTPMSSYDMCIGDFQFLLYKLRVVTHDNIYKVISRCPYCLSESSDYTVDLDKLKLKEYDGKIEDMKAVTLPKSGVRVTLNIQTPRMADDALILAEELGQENPNDPRDFTLLANLMMIIDTVDGEVLSNKDKESFIRNLPLGDSNLIINTVDKITEAVGYSNEVRYTCPICGLSYTGGFRTGGDFFRPGI